MKKSSSMKLSFAAIILAVLFSVSLSAAFPRLHTAEAATKVKLKSALNVKVGKSKKLKATAKSTVKWSITDKTVAAIKKSGNQVTITGKKDGVTAVVAKVGSTKVACRVTVGNGCSYAQITQKTKSALKMTAVSELVSYIQKKGTITLTTGNLANGRKFDADYDHSWNTENSKTWQLSVEGNHVVLKRTVVSKYQHDAYQDISGVWVPASFTTGETETAILSIPVDGTDNATFTSDLAWTDIDSYGKVYTSTEKISAAFSMSAMKVGAPVTITYIYASDDRTDTSTMKLYLSSNENWGNQNWRTYGIYCMINTLNALLTDNETGFTVSDLGFTSFTPSHYNIPKLTSADLANFAQENKNQNAFDLTPYTQENTTNRVYTDTSKEPVTYVETSTYGDGKVKSCKIVTTWHNADGTKEYAISEETWTYYASGRTQKYVKKLKYIDKNGIETVDPDIIHEYPDA